MDQISAEPSSKMEEGNKRGKRSNRKRHNNTKSQNATNEQVNEIVEGGEIISCEPSLSSSIEVSTYICISYLDIGKLFYEVITFF